MIELNEVVEAVCDVEVHLDGFVFKPKAAINSLTAEFTKSAREKCTDKDGLIDYETYRLTLLEKVLRKTDIGIKGKEIPPTVEGLRRIPTTVIAAYEDAILTRQNEQKKPKSPETVTT